MARVVTFGEVMIRYCPPGHLRLSQSLPGTLEATFGGAEVNVAVSIALQGGDAAFCTALPDNSLTDCFLQDLRKLGVQTDLVSRRSEGRFGSYFVETGANQRSGTVTYDRAGATIAVTPPEAYDWSAIFRNASWFHISGITPALSALAAETSIAAVQSARQAGVRISCDLNFRKKLWNWDTQLRGSELARRTMQRILAGVDVIIANEEDAEQVLGIQAAQTNVEQGELKVAAYPDVAREIIRQFPQVQQVAITLRESLSASHNNWGAMLYDASSGQAHFAPVDAAGHYAPYAIRNIVDRVGAGDAFAGGLIFALTTPELSSPESALRYAVAASCLKHSISGDFNRSSRAEIEALMRGSGSGRVQR
ncbi:MAG: sugar kinase [Planctomycetaceae bacterium]